MNKVLNWVMLVSLLLSFGSGMLLKLMPGMWLGILHAGSGLSLLLSALIHAVEHCKTRKKVERA